MNSLKLSAIAAAMLGAVSLVGTPASAAAIPAVKPAGVAGDVLLVGGGHHGGGHGGGGHHGGHHGHRGGYWGPGYGFVIGGPVYNGSGCGWLRRRAIDTGSRYWWRRYRDCRGW